ncbi:single-stranded-DNA-specific exonuclease RecJ [Moorena producens JHB]|uniref:Single-stranded-DNA-specific exonuclease RecJ n=1 Tax=Moorena producens (strain JHB) TaxID=1454205 RepID=A0A1D9GBM3_MOOP1|nr:single-stranded-DNA-specific exonuclease RecJ [Moorena producens]AOY84780.2 single-stranded-DNA-specific exonuclease RecJ [Moorena producens JHB]
MSESISQSQWQVLGPPEIPQWFIEAVKSHTKGYSGHYAAQLLWQRGIREERQLAGFLNPDLYQPTSPFDFGQEMKWAVKRLLQAREAGEKVAIWGDFDADGITATSVLWEGLGQFFWQHQQLSYYIPNRLTESHGLNCPGIDQLHASGVKLIVTCDTGSTNLREIDYAHQLGMDVIITDHHTLPDDRPPVVSIINSRYFAETHPLFNLSGVAVAYKLVEAMYQLLPNIPQQRLEGLLDLVAIGLIADLVELSGDCRYLAQRGIEQLKQQLQTRSRPGIARLLQLCKRSGDRPMDISFGLGPRINAVSRIQGDASFCVELLTSKDEKRCEQLALETELANTRRMSLQKDITKQVKDKLAKLDLSTTNVIVLEDPQWPVGVLGLVAGQIAQEYGRPTILLSTVLLSTESSDRESQLVQAGLEDKHSYSIARGSARSVNNIDLYELVNSQAHLLHRFGGHPFAAGLSLPVDNIPLFTEAINQQLAQKLGTTGALMMPAMEADLVVKVAELGKPLFDELKHLEPCGMGNPVPKMLIKNCWFEQVWNRNSKDLRGRKVQYIKTKFEIWDDSTSIGFPGIWWGHYKDEVPKVRCNAVVELDYNNYEKRPEVRLVAVQPCQEKDFFQSCFQVSNQLDWILDWRGQELQVGRFQVEGSQELQVGKLKVVREAWPKGQGSEELKVGRFQGEGFPDNLQPDHLQPVTKTNLQPDNLQPDNLQPDNLQPDNLQPDNLQPDNLQPDNLQPDHLQPDHLQPDHLQPVTKTNLQPDNLQPDNLQPDNLQPDNRQGLTPLMVYECPTSWDELQVWCRRAIQAERQLAIAYPRPQQLSAQDTWKKLLGIAKFLSRTGQSATLVQLQEKLDLSDRTVELGLNALSVIGFEVSHQDWGVQISWHGREWSSDWPLATLRERTNVAGNDAIALRARCANAIFFAAIEEEQFRRQYFYQVPLSTIAGYSMVGIKQD